MTFLNMCSVISVGMFIGALSTQNSLIGLIGSSVEPLLFRYLALHLALLALVMVVSGSFAPEIQSGWILLVAIAGEMIWLICIHASEHSKIH